MTTAVPRPSKSPRTRSGDACGDTGNRAGALRDQAILELVAGCGYIVVYTLCGFDRRARGLFGGPCFFARALMRTFIYVDGFNLYYGALKGTSWKWLDLVALFEKVLHQHHDILKVKYFTARVSGTTADQSKPQRQDI